jgi:hypothetical protein
MPYVATASRPGRGGRGAGLIELSIPMRIVDRAAQDGRDDDDLTCYICANAFCDEDECCRALTHLGCCTQSICCACLLKSSKRCRCKDDCDAVISMCPFCREVSPVDAIDVFLATKAVCADCAKADAAHAATVAASPEVDDGGETV